MRFRHVIVTFIPKKGGENGAREPSEGVTIKVETKYINRNRVSSWQIHDKFAAKERDRVTETRGPICPGSPC